jgi:hypothetical protein
MRNYQGLKPISKSDLMDIFEKYKSKAKIEIEKEMT